MVFKLCDKTVPQTSYNDRRITKYGTLYINYEKLKDYSEESIFSENGQ